METGLTSSGDVPTPRRPAHRPRDPRGRGADPALRRRPQLISAAAVREQLGQAPPQLVLALRSLWLHKLRAFLSVLGIIIGTAAVIALMAFGEGSMQDALDDIKRQGATNIIVRSVKPPDDSSTASKSFVATYGLTYGRLRAVQHRSATRSTRMVPMRVFPQRGPPPGPDAQRPGRRHHARSTPTSTSSRWPRGRFLIDGRRHATCDNVCVLGAAGGRQAVPLRRPDRPDGRHRQPLLPGRRRASRSGCRPAAPAAARRPRTSTTTSTSRSRRAAGGSARSSSSAPSGSRSGEKVELSQVTLTVNADVDNPEERKKVQAVGDVIKDDAGASAPARRTGR